MLVDLLFEHAQDVGGGQRAVGGAPQFIRSDNGPEFIARIIQRWLKDNGIKTIYIDPGCPRQNGYAESCNSRFRRECLDRKLI